MAAVKPNILHICLLLKMLMFSTAAFAQDYDDSTLAVPLGHTKYTLLQNLNLNPELLLHRDTNLYGIHRQYYPGHMQNLGNLGSPVFPLVWQPQQANGFNFGFRQWDALRLTTANMPLFNTQNPFTHLNYAMGPEKLQSVSALHSQNIFPYWNASFQLMREGSEGYYIRQNSRRGNFGLNTWYRSPSRRYMAAAAAVFNDFNFQENGGIINDSVFLSDSLSNRNRRSIPVQLENARQEYEDQDVTVRQYVYFGPRHTENVASDTDTVAIKILKPRFYITHQANFYNQYYKYIDEKPRFSFYPETIDSTGTNNGYRYTNFTNKAGIGYFYADTMRGRNYGLQVYGKYAVIQVVMPGQRRNLNNTSAGAEAVMGGKLRINAAAEVFLNGYNAGDFFIDGNVKIPFLQNLGLPFITAHARMQQYEPDYIENNFSSNHFNWQNNNFNKTQSILLGGDIWGSNTSATRAGVAYAALTNFVYFDENIRPVQAQTGLQYLRFNVVKELRVWKLHFLHDVTYQQQLQGNFIRIPEWVIRTSYYFNGKIIPNSPLVMQLGFDLWYNSSYYGYSYMPGISRFVVQDTVLIGDYPVFDVWLAARVKRFMFFGKLEHVTQGLFGNNYFNAVHYPMQPFTFRLGLRWSFYN